MKWCGGMVTEHCSSVETANVQSEMSHPALPVRLTPCHGLSHRARFASVPDINSIRDFQMRPSFASWGLLALLLLQGPLLQAQPLSPALQQLLSLSSQRLQLADQVAQSKAQSGKAVQDSPRKNNSCRCSPDKPGATGSAPSRCACCSPRRSRRTSWSSTACSAGRYRTLARRSTWSASATASISSTWSCCAATPRRSPNCASTTAGRGSTRRCNGRYASIAWTSCTPSPCHGRRAISSLGRAWKRGQRIA